MTSVSHEQAQDLIAPLAVDALEPDERDRVLTHVSDCEICRRDLDELQEAAALLGTSAAAPPDSLWQNIHGSLGRPAPPLKFQTRRHFRHQAALTVAACLLTGVVVSAAFLGLGSRGDIETSEQQLAQAARDQSNSQVIPLANAEGSTVAEVILLPNGNAYLTNTSLPDLRADRTYQVWTISTDRAVSAALLGSRPSVANFSTAPGVDAIAITEEGAGGVVTSTETPIALGQVSRSA